MRKNSNAMALKMVNTSVAVAKFLNYDHARRDNWSDKAGVTMSVSNGPVEGHINRLKMLKRQMYGRAKIDLLERRFLLAT